MFKKGPDIDKKKLLAKASDVKKDSTARLKNFKMLLEHSDHQETFQLFKSHSSFIYHTFIETFSNFDCNSKQRLEDQNCILFMLEKILIFNTDLIKKRWQFYSLTFVMQKLLHQENIYEIRYEGVRLFILWYEILCDESNTELQTIFASIVPELAQFQESSSNQATPIINNTSPFIDHQQEQGQYQKPLPAYGQSTIHDLSQHYSKSTQSQPDMPTHQQQNVPIKLSSIEPLVPISPNDPYPTSDESSVFLDLILQNLVTQTTRPFWNLPQDEVSMQQEKSFAFLFDAFKRTYLQSIFPNIDPKLISDSSKLNNNNNNNHSAHQQAHNLTHSIHQYVDDVSTSHTQHSSESGSTLSELRQPARQLKPRDFKTKLDYQATLTKQQSLNLSPTNIPNKANFEHDYMQNLSIYQSIVIRWLTRILRQDIIPGQDELIRTKTAEARDHKEDQEYSHINGSNSTNTFQGMETSCKEMEIARAVLGARSENIAIAHELFRGSFMNFFQPASMKRVVNVYREWICNGRATTASGTSGSPQSKFGYTTFPDLLQTFVINSSNAFLTKVHNPAMLDEQVEMCKRIMNIYRYMVMKIYMNTSTWEQLLTIMLAVTEHIFPVDPPKLKDSTIGGRIAPAFFQTFLVSWIRANLYVHISEKMWRQFHRVMKNLVKWRELIEEWSSTMSSLTRVLVKNVYGLNLNDLPLDKPQGRRQRRPRDGQSFSTSAGPTNQIVKSNPPSRPLQPSSSTEQRELGHLDANIQKSIGFSSRIRNRSNSDSFIYMRDTKLIPYTFNPVGLRVQRMRKIRSEYIIPESLDFMIGRRSTSPTRNDELDASNLKHSIDHALESQLPSRSSYETSSARNQGKSKQNYTNASPDSSAKLNSSPTDTKCVLLGGNVRGWTPENSVVMWRRMLGLFGNVNLIEDPQNHLIAIKCLAIIQCEFIKTRENLGISMDNKPTPVQPDLIPPYTYHAGWLFEASHLPDSFIESRIIAYKLLCLLTIRRHDIELPQSYYTAFYEAMHRGLACPDPSIYASIVKHSPQLLSLELPGSTFLVQVLFERSRSIILNSPKELTMDSSPCDEAIQILNHILALNKRLKKLMVLKPDANGSGINLVAPGDLRSKIYDTFLACNIRPFALDFNIRSKSLFSMAAHVYQELSDKCDTPETDKLFDILWTDLQHCDNGDLFRISCDMIRLFSDHAQLLAQTRPNLVIALLQIMCQLIIRMSTSESNKEQINCSLICLEDWCIALGKQFLSRQLELSPNLNDDENFSAAPTESLIMIVLKSLIMVANGEQYVTDDLSNKTIKNSELHTNSGMLQAVSPTDASSQISGLKDRTLTNESMHQHNQNFPPEDHSRKLKAISMACRVTHQKLITYLGHFPLRQVGGASLSSYVDELDFYHTNDLEFNGTESANEICFLEVEGAAIVTFIGSTSSPDSAELIIRNPCGKYSWNVSRVGFGMLAKQTSAVPTLESLVVDPDSFELEDPRSDMRCESDLNDDGTSTSSMSSRGSSNRDCIGDLLNFLTSLGPNGNSTSSLLSNQSLHKKRNCALSVTNPEFKVAQAEETMIALLTNQRFQEINYCERANCMDRVVLKLGPRERAHYDQEKQPGQMSFDECRQLIQQIGFLSWEKRPKIEMLTKSARLIRELKNLDAQPSRETHKIAVIFVGNGQEDRQTILSNATGSKAFEEFVSGLGWEVNLATHLGFKGGLQPSKSTGETSLYYCNCTTEVMYHVSTRIPLNNPIDDESLNRKLRHLGNDEIHIVWSEHTRDYRRGIIPTEFGDVIIAIYPMLTFQGYYRIQLLSKPEVPPFGPLFNNCVVHQASLASLVRATAINASRARRLKLDHYLSSYEERARLIDAIVTNYKAKLSFEEFASQLYSLPKNNNSSNKNNKNNTKTTTTMTTGASK